MRLADIRVAVETSTRTDWRFPYTAKELSDAARDQADFHEGRAAHWEAEVATIDGQMQGSVQLREQQVTGGVQYTAVIDPEVSRRLNDAKARRDRHAERTRTFRAYAEAFGRRLQKDGDDVTHQLSVEDIDFFAIHRDPGD